MTCALSWAGAVTASFAGARADPYRNPDHVIVSDFMAKARGVKMGRRPKLTEHQKPEAIRRRDCDGEPVREIARSYNVSHSTISRPMA